MQPRSIQEYIEHEEQMERRNLRNLLSLPEPSTPTIYQDGGSLICEDCGSVCERHIWSPRLQAWIGECCQVAETDLLPANYAAEQCRILEEYVGVGVVPLIDEALAHLRLVKMQQSPDPHVAIAIGLLAKAKEAA